MSNSQENDDNQWWFTEDGFIWLALQPRSQLGEGEGVDSEILTKIM